MNDLRKGRPETGGFGTHTASLLEGVLVGGSGSMRWAAVDSPVGNYWLQQTRESVRNALVSSPSLVEQVVSQYDDDELVVTVLSNETSYSDDFATTIAALEIDLTKVLADRFRWVTVRAIPMWALSEEELAILSVGTTQLL